MATADAFGHQLSEALAADDVQAVDMSAVTFIDSSGLHALYRCAVELDGKAPLTIRNPSRFVRSLLEIAGFGDMTEIEIERDG